MILPWGIFLMDVCRSQKRASKALELELQVVLRTQYQATEPGLSAKGTISLNPGWISQIFTSKDKLSLLNLDQDFTISFIPR